MNALKFLYTRTNSVIRLEAHNSLLLSVIPDREDEGMFYAQIADNGKDAEMTEFSFMSGTIMLTFGLTSDQFLNYITE
jgi:hypothetical protein